MPNTPPDISPEYKPTLDWLLASQEPWVVYNTLHDLVGATPDSPEVQAAYYAMQQHPSIISMLEELQQWPAKPLDRAYDPKDSIWKLGTLADFGLHRNDERIAALAMANLPGAPYHHEKHLNSTSSFGTGHSRFCCFAAL